MIFAVYYAVITSVLLGPRRLPCDLSVTITLMLHSSLTCSALCLRRLRHFQIVLSSNMSPYSHRLPVLRLIWLHLQAS